MTLLMVQIIHVMCPAARISKAILFTLFFGLSAMTASAVSFSEMSGEEITALLADASESSAAAKATVAPEHAVREIPVEVTAEDLVTKIYGVIDPSLSKQECSDQAFRILRLRPQEDNAALWLETSDGYGISYYGMRPEVSAMARFGGETLSDFCFFFLFPYQEDSKRECTRRQADFCGSLLQEMHDIGIPMGRDSLSDDLFEASGSYKGNFVDVRLLEEQTADNEGRYILILSVEPGGFLPVDDIYAEL